jgi:hypothetical protein
MTRSQAREYRDRWQAVADVEAEERRSASLRLRWEQMNSLRRLALGLELSVPSMDEQERIIWERWAKLKELNE